MKSELQDNEEKGSSILEKIKNYKNKDYLAYCCIFIANITWCSSFIYSNENNLSFAETNFIRGFSLLLVNFPICRYYQFDLGFRNSQEIYWLNIRNLVMVLHGIAMAISQFILPLPIVHTISSTGNLYIFFWDYYLYGNKISKEQVKGVVVGMIGVLLVVNGRLILYYIDPTYEVQTQFQNYLTKDPILITLFGIVFSIVIFIWGYAIVITKKLKNTNSSQLCFHQGIMLSLTNAILYPVTNKIDDLSTLAFGFLGVGIPLALGQLFFIGGLLLSKNTGIITMIMFITVGLSYFFSIFRYNESQNVFCTFGVVLIIGGLWKVLFSKNI